MPDKLLPPLALYVHFPWCVRKCPYCDFNSHAVRGGVPEDAYVDAMLRDLEQMLPLVWGRPLRSIFFGGGTPSLFSVASVQRLLDHVRAYLNIRPDIEITMEMNPGTLDASKLGGFRQAGVNRLSIGAQSFNDTLLQRIGRIHEGEHIRQAIPAARAAGFDNINLDLMYALPGQTEQQAIDDVQQACDYAPEHISHYQLTLEPNTYFHKYPPPQLPDVDGVVQLEHAARARLHEHGYAQYEVSAFALAGRECVHNLNYWNYGDYIGLGAGAHGKLSRYDGQGQLQLWRHIKPRHPDHYIRWAQQGAVLQEQAVPDSERPFEFLLNGLRLKAGFAPAIFRERTGLCTESLRGRLHVGMERGWVLWEEKVRATDFGYAHLNVVLESVLD